MLMSLPVVSPPVLSFGRGRCWTGLARDGGLYVPETIPTLSTDELREMATMSYEDVAFSRDETRLLVTRSATRGIQGALSPRLMPVQSHRFVPHWYSLNRALPAELFPRPHAGVQRISPCS